MSELYWYYSWEVSNGWLILMSELYWYQQKTNEDSDQGFENECTLVWVKLLGFSMELWMEKRIQAIGDRISKTILVYGSFLTSSFQLVAKLLVELKVSDGLY